MIAALLIFGYVLVVGSVVAYLMQEEYDEDDVGAGLLGILAGGLWPVTLSVGVALCAIWFLVGVIQAIMEWRR